MYGKVMSIPDNVMPIYFKLATRYTPAQIREVEAALKNNSRHPRDVKMELAREIVEIFHGKSAVEEAEGQFKRVFQEGEAPEEMPEFKLPAGATIVDVLLGAKLASSKSEARRLIEQKGVRLDGETLERGDVPFPHAGVLQAGKRKFVRVK